MLFHIIISIAFSLATVKYSSQVDVDKSITNDAINICNQLEGQFQTSYSTILCQLTVSNDIFDKLYNVSMNSEEAEMIFSNIALFFAESLGLPHEGPLHVTVSDAAKRAFSNDITPMDYFKFYQKSSEDYLLKEGILTEENSKALAEKHFRTLQESLNSYDLFENPFAMAYAATEGNANFLKSLGKISPENIQHMMGTFSDAIHGTIKH